MALPRKHFEVFGIQPAFHINQDTLKTAYFELSKQLHPDRTSESSAIEEINRAYAVLKNDFSRARYLAGEHDFAVDTAFLVEMLDYEERISAASAEEQIHILRDLDRRIAECKLNFASKEHLCRWGYYERLRKLLRSKQE